ncbi:MAG: NAD(P)/FAD-dependent oxidoreductase [Hyphomicrobiaceae bacterium]|nr:NAD(P)/FAD-dependent oxidoreductase [Hyphomicrobiaceae bacterium]
MTSAESWCVIGGGVLGLTLAARLAGSGRDVTLLEASDRLGGLADAWQVGEITWDRHYHVTLLSDVHLRNLLTELGLHDDLQWGTTRTDFYTNGRFDPLNNAIDYLKFPPLGLIDKVRLAGTILYASRIEDGRPLEKVPIADWLTKLSGRRTYEVIWRPLLRAKLGENYRQASAAFIWAIIRRLYAARRSGMKTEMFGYIDGGYDRVFKRFAQVLGERGVNVRTSSPVRRIAAKDGRLVVETALGPQEFDRVVVTTAAPLAARICEGLSDDEKARLNGILYQGIICASVVLKRPLHQAYITYIADDTVPYTAVIEMSALVDRDKQLGGNTLVYLPRYVKSDDPMFEASDADIQTSFQAALLRMYPELKPDDIVAFKISRVRQVLAVSTLNYTDRLPPKMTSVPGLSIVNSAHIVNGTLNVNETVKLAQDVLPQLLAASPGR